MQRHWTVTFHYRQKGKSYDRHGEPIPVLAPTLIGAVSRAWRLFVRPKHMHIEKFMIVAEMGPTSESSRETSRQETISEIA